MPGAVPQSYAKNGWRYDNRVTAMMVEDMVFDPVLATKVLLNIRVPPHEELRILWMWTHYFTLDDSGFSTGKSYTYAIVSALRSILFPGRISGILSGTFRQGKLIFQNYTRWWGTSKIFRSCIKMHNGKPRLVHGQEVHEAFFRGGAQIRVLPPNFMQDAQRLRSERWHDGYLDEWTTFGSFHALTATILGRITAYNENRSCPVRQNHVHLSSVPAFVHDPAYKIVERIQANIDSGDKNFSRFTCNYRHIPRTKVWSPLIDRKTIYAMQTMNPPGVVGSEIDGEWQSDSKSYYSSSSVRESRKEVMALLKCYAETDVYVAGMDVARGREDNNKSRGDDFSLSVWRIPGEKLTPPHPCYAVRKNNITAQQMSGIVHDAHHRFHLSAIVYDPSGGGLFVRDEVKKPEQLIDNEKKTVVPILEVVESSGAIGDNIMIAFGRGSMPITYMWGKMPSESILVNRMHKEVRGAIENLSVYLPEEWSGWENVGFSHLDAMRDFLNASVGLRDLERVKAELDLAVRQLVLVDVERDEGGQPRVDKYNMFKFKSKSKKDAAYGMCYGYIGVLILDNRSGQALLGNSNRRGKFAFGTNYI